MLRGLVLSLGWVIEICRAGEPIVMAVFARAIVQFYLTTSDSLRFGRLVIARRLTSTWELPDG